MLKPVLLRVQDIQNQVLTAKTADGQTWRIPITGVYGAAKPESELRLIAVVPGSEDAGRQAFAHTLLNELLGQEPSSP